MKQKQLIKEFLLEKKKEFVQSWRDSVEGALPALLKTKYVFALNDFHELFDAYLTDGWSGEEGFSPSIVTELIKDKIQQGFPLSMIGILNAYFMATARGLVRGVYPDSFDSRMEFLEALSQRVLNNEIVLSQYYEDYVRDLNARFREQADAFERRHALLLEFIDCSTQELQAPLWSILGFTAKLQRKYYPHLQEDGKHCLNRIAANVGEMHQLITDMTSMLLIEEQTMKKQEVRLAELLDACRERVRTEVDKNFEVIHDDGKIVLTGDRAYLSMLFYHLFKNAAQYVKGDEPGRLHVRSRTDHDFHLYLEDEGIGIAPPYRELVFKPLERLKEKTVEGSGMGLAFACRIVSGHKGSITLEDSSFGGVCVHLVFPLAMMAG